MAFFYPAAEYRRPWKLATLAVGVGLLLAGSVYTPAPDWDVPISLVMAACAYLSAAPSLRAILERRWRRLPAVLAATWFSVDGCYALYWSFRNPQALELMRSANAPASLALYGACGVVWLYRGSLAGMLAEGRGLFRQGPTPPNGR